MLHNTRRNITDISDIVRDALGLRFDSAYNTAVAMKEFEQDAILAASSHCDQHTARSLLAFRQVTALYTKNPSLSGRTDEDRSTAALKSFFQVESYQRVVSKRLRHFFGHQSRKQDVCMRVLNHARMDIFKLIGPGPSGDDIARTLELARFGPGSVGGLPHGESRDVTPYGKLGPAVTIHVSLACLQYWGPHLRGVFRTWLDSKPAVLQEYCKATTVPKDCKTDRFIAVEPYLNSYVQLGQMSWLVERLKRWDVDLSSQSRNQTLAYLASRPKSGVQGWATLDLSSASDSVNLELVRWLLPPDWFAYFSSTRSSSVDIGGRLVPLEKFSSMGNGNTFPLETMIFCALTRACRSLTGDQLPYAVYGDDIIIGCRSSLLLIEVLSFCGFKLNRDKSFIIGYFKESCGKDYLGGHPVRPVYLKSELTEDVKYSLANSLQQNGGLLASKLFGALVASIRRPLIGPAVSNDGSANTHLVAPVDVLRRRGVIKWDPSYQRWTATFPALRQVFRQVSQKKKAECADQAYMAWLAQTMLSGPHSVREGGHPRWVIAVVTRGVYSFSPQYDASWRLWV